MIKSIQQFKGKYNKEVDILIELAEQKYEKLEIVDKQIDLNPDNKYELLTQFRNIDKEITEIFVKIQKLTKNNLIHTHSI